MQSAPLKGALFLYIKDNLSLTKNNYCVLSYFFAFYR